MNPIERLRTVLWGALATAPLGTFAACDDGPRSASANVEPEPDFPSCRSGTWCGPKTAAQQVVYEAACPGGRPLRDGDGVLTAEARPGVAWSEGNVRPTDVEAHRLPDDVRSELAAAWRADGLAEHASVASFARATLELMAVGAPPDLVAATQRASLDEVEHARLCFGLAGAYGDDVTAGPLPLPAPRSLDVPALAAAVFEEGCAGETVAALVADVGAGSCRIPAVRDRLRRIATEESDHAALAWQTLAWLVQRGGAPVVAALREAAERLEAELVLASEQDAPSPVAALLREHGRVDGPAQRALRRQAWRELVAPLLERVCRREAELDASPATLG